MNRRYLIGAVVVGALLAFLAAVLMSSRPALADTPVTIKAVGRIQIMPGYASLTITHGKEGGTNLLKFHVNLRPDGTPGGGPGTKNTLFWIKASDPSPETITVPLPSPIDGYCYVQADARWTGGRATSPRVPIPAGCKSPTPTPTPSHSSTPTPTPSVTHHSPKPSSHTSPSTLPKTGMSPLATTSLWTAGILMGLGLMILLAGRMISVRPRRH